MDLSVIVPCLNEEGNIPELVARIGEVFRKGGIDGEVLFVDDGSTDDTWNELQRQKESHSFVVPLRHARNQGIAAAWKTALASSRGELVCLIDADLQYQPEDILRLKRELEYSNVDIVQGWRSPVGREKGPRYWYSRGLNTILNTVFGMRLRDNKSGFVLTSREVMQDLFRYRGTYAYWQSFIMVAAHVKGYSYKQIETLFEARHAGQSFLANAPFSVIAKSFVDIGKAFFEYRRRDSLSPERSFLAEQPLAVRRDPEPEPWRRLLFRGYMSVFRATHWMMTRDVERYLDDLRDSQWLSPSRIRELQERKMRRLIHHAYGHVPFYRERMRAAGLEPKDIRTIDDLQKLPMLTKADVRRHLYFDMMSDNHNKSEVLRVTTSGSTGEPFACFVDRAQLEFRWAATLRSMEWTGYRFGDRQLRLWHQTIGMSKSQVVREVTDAFLSRRKFVPAYALDHTNIDKLIDLIETWQPVLMDGYAESFNLLAQYLQQHGTVRVQPKGIISSAQSLPDPVRQRIEQAFGCRVFDKYGSREFSGIAYESDAHDGHLVVAEGYIVEVLKDGRPALPGEVGEVVITDLNNFCMPFIRYRIGDLAEAMDPNVPSPCGRGLPRLGRIEGRVQSIIIGANGRYMPGTFFAHLFKDYDYAVRQFQVVQEERDAITLRITRGPRFTEEALAEILGLLHEFLGTNMRIDVVFEKEIELIRTGKRLASVSRLPIDFQNLGGSPG